MLGDLRRFVVQNRGVRAESKNLTVFFRSNSQTSASHIARTIYEIIFATNSLFSFDRVVAIPAGGT